MIEKKWFYETEFRPEGSIWIPTEIVLQGERPTRILRWQTGVGKLIRPKDEMLDEFLRLSSASDENVLRYSRKWGVLGICKHGLPYGHNPSTGAISQAWDELVEDSIACAPVPIGSSGEGKCYQLEFQESLEDWRRYARAAQSMCNIRNALEFERMGDPIDWQNLFNFSHYPRRPVPWWERDIEAEWFILIRTLNEWLRWGEVRPVFNGSGKELWGVCLGKKGLFGALAYQIMLAISRPQRVLLCSGCKTIFIAMKRSGLDRRHYCGECRNQKVPGRDAAHDYRARKKKQLRDRGKKNTF